MYWKSCVVSTLMEQIRISTILVLLIQQRYDTHIHTHMYSTHTHTHTHIQHTHTYTHMYSTHIHNDLCVHYCVTQSSQQLQVRIGCPPGLSFQFSDSSRVSLNQHCQDKNFGVNCYVSASRKFCCICIHQITDIYLSQ